MMTKIIDVLNMVAEGKIKEGTKIILNDDLFIFNGGVFGSGLYYLENCMFLKKEDSHQEVELISPKKRSTKLYPKYPSMIAKRRMELEYVEEVDESLSTSK